MSHPNKPRLRWTVELHERFVDAVTQLGGPDKATPKNIQRVMAVEGLTLDHIKSHLQQFRLGKQPGKEFNDHSKDLQQFKLGKQPHKEFRDHSMKEVETNKRAVVVGISYKHSIPKVDDLPGCINDARAIREMLVNKYGFKSSNVEFITDEPGSETLPTGKNIRAALNKMVSRAQPGNVLLFYFAGHGTIIHAESSRTKKNEEAIVPSDFNIITCVDFRLLVNQAPANTNFTFLADSSHSGGLINNGTEQIGPGKDQDGKEKRDKMIKPRRGALMDDDDDHDQVDTPRTRSMTPYVSLVNQVSATTGIYSLDFGDHMVNYATSSMSRLSMLDRDQVEITQPRGMILHESLLNQVSTMTGINSPDIGVHMVNFHGNEASSMFRLPSYKLPRAMPEKGILVSACERNEKAHERKIDGKWHGCFSHALLTRLREHGDSRPISNRQLVLNMRETVRKMGVPQHPCLYCGRRNSDAPFARPNN